MAYGTVSSFVTAFSNATIDQLIDYFIVVGMVTWSDLYSNYSKLSSYVDSSFNAYYKRSLLDGHKTLMELQLPKNTVLCLKVVPDCFRSRKQLLLHMNIPALSSDKDESMTSPSSISLIVRLLLELHDPFQYARIRSNPGVIAYLQSIDSLLQVIHKSHSLSSKSLATAISLVQEYQKPIQNSESPTIDLIDVSHHLEQILSLAHSIAGTVSFSVVTR